MIKLMIILEMVALASLAVAEDFRALDGREYKNVTVSRVEPDGIVLVTSSGISKLYFTELPKEVQERFHYDAQKAAAYSASQNVVQQQLAKVQQEATTKQEKVHRLEALYTELDQNEDALMQRIATAEVGQYQAIPNPDRAQLAFLHSELDKVRRDKDQVIQELEQARR